MSPRRRVAIVVIALAASLVLLAGIVLVIGGVGSALATTEREARTYRRPVQRIVVDVQNGLVEVVAAPAGSDVRVRRASRGFLVRPELAERLRDGELRLDSRCPGGILGPCGTDYRIEAPADVSLHLESTAGDVRVRGVEGDVTTTTTAGEVELRDLRSRRVEASSTAGDVTVDLRAIPDDVRASTTAGDVEVTLPAGTYNVDAESDAGDQRIEGVIDDPGAPGRIEVETTAGDASVRAR